MRPLIIVDPQPRGIDDIFDKDLITRLESIADVEWHHGAGQMDQTRFDSLLSRAELLIGQSDMPRHRLDQAPMLRAIINVETNFLQNVDYDTCFQRGIHVLAPSSAFAKPVAEMTLGLLIDLARGITASDRAMRAGQEKWLLDGWTDHFSLYGSDVGLIGFGDLARAFLPLIQPFGCRIKAYDPWVSPYVMNGFGVTSASLHDVLSTSRAIIVFASATSQNQGFLGKPELSLIQKGAALLVMSRAAVVDFDALTELVSAGRFRAATDVFPTEPVPNPHPVRAVDGLLLSPHRAGATPDALLDIGRQTVADAELILNGFPPLSCRRAQRETVNMSRSKPIERS